MCFLLKMYCQIFNYQNDEGICLLTWSAFEKEKKNIVCLLTMTAFCHIYFSSKERKTTMKDRRII